MSAEAEVSEGLEKPMGSNAQSAEDAKKLLAELEGEAAAQTTEDKLEEKTNGAAKEDDKEDDDAQDRSPDRRRSNRNDRDRDGYRGRGRGGGGRGGRFGGGAGGRNHRDNIKSDLTTQEESSDPVEIRKQVEFYFSDGNLPYDKFLLNAVGGSKNNPVELSTIHSFKRMRHFQPFSAIVDAMRESTFLELCENDTCVKRTDPLPTEFDEGPDPNAIRIFEDRAMPRCVYAKGFGEEAPSTQFDIEAFFAPYGPTNAVRLRRSEDKLFKGSVFVEFETEELASAFLEVDPKPHFNGKDLQIMSKKEYCDKKVDDIKAGKIKANTPYDKPHRGRGGGDRRGGFRDRDGDRFGKRKRDDEDDRDWRVRRDEDKKNGFRDHRDRRRGGGGDRRDRDGRGHDRKTSKVETDENGIPKVRTEHSPPSSASKRDAAKDKVEALAKARAIVEEQNAKIKELEETGGASNGAETNGKKRERENDGDEGAAVEPEAKKAKEVEAEPES